MFTGAEALPPQRSPQGAATTPGLDDEDRALIRERVAGEIAETYPRFAATLLAA